MQSFIRQKLLTLGAASFIVAMTQSVVNAQHAVMTRLEASAAQSAFGQNLTLTARVDVFATPPAGSIMLNGYLAAGYSHTCAVKVDGLVICWGDNTDQQLNVPSDTAVIAIAAGTSNHSCAIQAADNRVVCWGNDSYGKSTVPLDDDLLPIQATAIATNNTHSCALRPDGAIRCWGDNSEGQRKVPSLLGPWRAVATGYLHSCGIRLANGLVHCWGNNDYNQTVVPLNSSTGEEIVATAISAGDYHTCALTTSGAVMCWGENADKQSDAPSGKDFAAVVAGDSHTCALRNNGAVDCWGSDYSDQATVPDGVVATALAAGSDHTCALTADGNAVCWGDDYHGQRSPPVPGGTVTFKQGTRVIAADIPLMDRSAILESPALRLGALPLTSVYNGDATFLAAASPAVPHLVTGTNGGETLRGTAAGDVLYGMGGNDVILGLAGNDTLDGGEGDDRISGGAGRDTIAGGPGNDRIDGGAGKDRMTGGPGADTFVFRRASDSPAGKPDVITDFKVGQGDRIDLTKFDGNLRQKGKQRFTEYRGTRRFTGKAGQLRFNRQRNRLEGDTTGNGRANFSVVLQGVTRLPRRSVKM